MVETGPRQVVVEKVPRDSKIKNQKKGNVVQVEGSSFGGTVQAV